MQGKFPIYFVMLNIMAFCLQISFAQDAYRVSVINSDKGLSQNSVYSIFKDSKGFLWIGTGDGLNRYDGKEFTVFRKSLREPSSLNGYSLKETMYEDEQQRLWLSTERNLVCFDQRRRTFQDIIPFGITGNKYIVDLDSIENTIWFIQVGLGLFSYDYQKRLFKKFDFPSAAVKEDPFSEAHGSDDGKGNIWITSLNGLYRFNKRDKTWEHTISNEHFSELCIDRNGIIWLLNRDYVFRYLPAEKKLSVLENPSQKSGAYWSIAADNNNTVWLGTTDGNLYRCNSEKNKVSWVFYLPSVTGTENVKEMRCIFFDPSGLLWIGTEGGGIVKIDLDYNNFKIFPELPSKVGSIFIKSLYSDTDSLVWIGTFKKWIYLFNPYSREVASLVVPKNKFFKQPTGGVYSITKDENGIIWIGYNNILISFNKKNQQFYFHPIPKATSENNSIINQIRVENNDLILTTTIGIFKVIKSKDGRKTSFKRIYLTTIYETLRTEDGALWASSGYFGLLKFSPEGIFEKKVASGTGIRCIIEDRKHKMIWAATQSGLLAYHIPDGAYRIYDERDGLASTYLYGILKSEKELWASTNLGLAKGEILFNKGNVFPEIQFKRYTKESGLQSDEFNTGAYCKTADGIYLFGGTNGLNWFRPEEIIANTHQPTVAITGLKINDSVYNNIPSAEFLKKIQTDFYNNTILIKFIGMEFHMPKEIRYRFRLDGLEKNWTEERNVREVRYANIPPGKYTFRLYALNSEGLQSNETTLAIEVLPPFYKTWWFLSIAIVTLVLLIVFITKYISQIKLRNRIRVLEKEKAVEEERHRISKEMHDDLGAGLTQISLISEAARRRNYHGHFPHKELNDIADTSRKLIENVSEIIWAMNPDFDSLSGLIAYLREQVNKLLEYSDKHFYVKIPETYTDLPLSNITRKNIIMMVKEAVNNAIKHSKATEIGVEIQCSSNRLGISVRDNGNGFGITNGNSGNGLKNYKYRAGILEGTVDIQSGETGTVIRFDIPVKS